MWNENLEKLSAKMEHTLVYVCAVTLSLCLVACDIRHSTGNQQGTRWSHGCRGIPGLNQTVNTLRCPVGCTIAIHQVGYGTKNRPGCPYEISHPVEPHCCYTEATDDCYQNKSQKIPMLQLLCREAAHMCQLSVDRVAIRCPRNAFSISTMRSILYSCTCASSPSTSTAETLSSGIPQTETETVTDPLHPSTFGASASSSSHSIANSTWLPRSDQVDQESTKIVPLSRSQLLSTAPSIRPLKPGSSASTGETVDFSDRTRQVTVDVDSGSLPIRPSAVHSTTPTATTTTTTPWTLTAENHPTHGLPSSGPEENGIQLHSDNTVTAGRPLNGTVMSGVIGGAAMIFLISVLAVVILCVRRNRRKSEAQGTEEASQYAYEIMDISLRRPQPVVTPGPGMTPQEDGEEAQDINLEGQQTQGTFLEKQIQRYLITSIYAEIKDFKRTSQESDSSTKSQSGTKAKVKPIPKPRKISDLYAKVNKRDEGKPKSVDKKCESDQLSNIVSSCKNVTESDRANAGTDTTKSDTYDGIYSICADPPTEPTTTASTYDRLVSCDTINGQNEGTMNRAGSGPYDELYTVHNTQTIRGIRYFNNTEYATVNISNTQQPTSKNRDTFEFKET